MPFTFGFTKNIETEFSQNVGADESSRIHQPELHIPGVNGCLILKTNTV